MAAQDIRCGTCKWLEAPLDKNGRRILTRLHGHRCSWPTPEQPTMADSITRAYDFRWDFSQRHRTHVRGNDGATCPTWESFK